MKKVRALNYWTGFVSAALLLFSLEAFAQRPLGIDVSSYQGSHDSLGATNIDWALVKSSGRAYAWVKCGETVVRSGWTYLDPDFTYNMTHAVSAGVPVGMYYFAHPEMDSAASASAYFLSIGAPYLKGTGQYLNPQLDYETSPGSAYTKASSSQWVNDWCNAVVNYGKSNGVVIKPVVYTYVSFATSWLDTTVTNWPLWMASPNGQSPATGAPNSVSPWSNWSLWQYGGGIVSGISGNVDEDSFNGTSAQFFSQYTIVPAGPVITKQPTNINVALGQNATFSVTATGTGTLHYQWNFNGTAISNAIATSYTVTNAQLNTSGTYAVSVTDTVTNTLSHGASLGIYSPLTNGPNSDVCPIGMQNWWTCDGNLTDLFGTNDATPQGAIYYTNGNTGSAIHFDGTTAMLTTGAAELAAPWTVCLWVNRQNTPQASGNLIGDGIYSLKLEQSSGNRAVGVSIFGTNDYVLSPSYVVPAGIWTHLAFVGTTTNTSLYVNGVLKSTLAVSIPLGRNYIGANYYASVAKTLDFMLGSLDEIMVFNKALTAQQISGIYATGGSGIVRAPEITGNKLNSSGNQFTLNLRGLTGKNYAIYTSTDLTNWTLLTALVNTYGTNQITDAYSTNSPQKYYRISQKF